MNGHHTQRARCAALALSTLIALAPLHGQDPDAVVTKLIDIRLVTTPLVPQPALPFFSLLDVGNEDGDEVTPLLSVQREPIPLMEVDEFAEMLMTAYPALREYEVDPYDSHVIVVRAPTALVANAERAARDFARTMAVPIAIDAVLIHHDGSLSPPAILDAAQATALFDGHEAKWRGAAHAPPGLATTFGQHKIHSYTRQNVLEVAEDALVVVPLSRRLFDGVALQVVPNETTAQGRLMVQAQFAVSDLISLTDIAPLYAQRKPLQRPELRVTVGTMSGMIDDGGALVLRTAAPAELGGSFVLAVRARKAPTRVPAAANRNQKDLQLDQRIPIITLPVSALTRPNVTSSTLTPKSRTGEVFAHEGEWFDMGLDDEGFSLDPDLLEQLVCETVTIDAWGDTAQLTYIPAGMVIAGAEASRVGTAALVRALEQQFLRTTEVTVSYGDATVSVPCIIHRPHQLRHGIERTAITGVECEIATKAGENYAVVRDVFHGLHANFETTVLADGQVAASLNWAESSVGKIAEQGAMLPTIGQADGSFSGPVPSAGVAGHGLFGKQVWSVRER